MYGMKCVPTIKVPEMTLNGNRRTLVNFPEIYFDPEKARYRNVRPGLEESGFRKPIYLIIFIHLQMWRTTEDERPFTTGDILRAIRSKLYCDLLCTGSAAHNFIRSGGAAIDIV